MSLGDVASLSESLLVVKGAAAPTRPSPQRLRRATREDPRMRVGLRLDAARHRRLRLAAAHLHLPVQGVLLAALDHYLERIVPSVVDQECPCLGRCAEQCQPVPLRTP